MKKNYPVTGVEVALKDSTVIISTTDTRGIITSVNDDFVSLSGFATDELVGKSHNVIRHPEMPEAVFADLWTTIKTGKSWMGIMKNRCKNGDHYWVDAYVAPIFEKGHIVGYQSVRRRATQERIDRAELVYQRLNRHLPAALPWVAMSTRARFTTALSVVWMSALWYAGSMHDLSWETLIGGAVLGVIVAAIFAHLMIAAWVGVAIHAEAVVDNALMQYIYTGRLDEAGRALMAINILQARVDTILCRIGTYANHLSTTAGESAQTAQQTSQGVLQQQNEIDQVAAAINEMSATVQEVARNAAAASQATLRADQEANKGKNVVAQTIHAINTLASEVESAAGVIARLEGDSASIGRVIDVIRSIAEQTNLLALNAAIEAARAGEQGRGFAVVADEVRTLAQRTQQSTQEIQQMIERLQSGAMEAVQVMAQGRMQAQASVEQAAFAGASLASITEAVTTITDMNTQIASAAEEQSTVAEEVNRNVVNISRSAEQTAERSQRTSQSSETLFKLSTQLEEIVGQFR